MARVIDETKIERIKAASLQMVVLKGYGGASISEIAKKAGVAEGYLYRHYSGKAELVNDLLFSSLEGLLGKLESLLENHLSVREIIRNLTQSLFDLATTEPERIKFLYVLMHDYNFKINDDQRNKIISLCKLVREMGHQSGELDMNIDEEEIYMIGVAYPIQQINLRLKGFFNNTFLGTDEIEKVIRIQFKLIK